MNKIKINGYTIINDKIKQYIHIEPVPTEKELEKVYKNEYYQKEKTDYIDNTLKDLDWWNTVYHDKYEIFNKYIEKNNRRILDIGSGSGHFLNFGHKLGWNCLGIEPSKDASEYSKKFGFQVINDSFKNKLLKNRKFEVIHMNQVLEHIPNPEILLSNIKSYLEIGGLICITVPNDFSILQELLHNQEHFKQWWISPPHHLNYFTVDSLSSLIEKLDFKIILKESSFPLEFFLLMDEDYINNPELGRVIHTKRKAFDLKLSKFNNDKKREFYQAMANLGFGRTITIYAKKVSE